MVMALDTTEEADNAAYLCRGKWYPCLILEKRLTGSYVIWPCAFCCARHHGHRILIPNGEKAHDLRTFPMPPC
jgi:hypothetical protein